MNRNLSDALIIFLSPPIPGRLELAFSFSVPLGVAFTATESVVVRTDRFPSLISTIQAIRTLSTLLMADAQGPWAQEAQALVRLRDMLNVRRKARSQATPCAPQDLSLAQLGVIKYQYIHAVPAAFWSTINCLTTLWNRAIVFEIFSFNTEPAACKGGPEQTLMLSSIPVLIRLDPSITGGDDYG